MSPADKSDKNVDNAKRKFASGVGYRKPPISSQFKKGQSGNPKGRPRLATAQGESRSAATLTLREAERVISVRDGDGVRQMTQIEAILRSQYVSASKGSAYAQRHIIERYERAETERRAAREADNERWRRYIANGHRQLASAQKEGKSLPLLLPHPDDVDIDPVYGVIFRGPFDTESLEQTHEKCALRDVLLLQDAFEKREGVHGDGPSTALFCALELNRGLAARFQLPELEICMRLMKFEVVPKRELRRSLRDAWRNFLGRDIPDEFLPPLDQFLGYLREVHAAYLELSKTDVEV